MTSRHRVTVLLAALLVALPAAAQSERPTREVIDETGRRVRVPARIERVVSLAPNVTEILYALGAEDRLVGVTDLCDYPPAARRKPSVGDVINPNLEKILELKPDVVLGTTAGNRRETVDALERVGVPLYGIDPHSAPEIFDSLRHVAELLDVPDVGERVAARLEARLAKIKARLRATERPPVLFVIWLEPLITAGGDTFLNDVLEHAGARSVTAELRESWPRLSVEEVIRRDPDVLILPRSHSLEASLAGLAGQPPWQRLRAVERNRILWMDDAVLRPGPRIVDAIEELARALHPDRFARDAVAVR